MREVEESGGEPTSQLSVLMIDGSRCEGFAEGFHMTSTDVHMCSINTPAHPSVLPDPHPIRPHPRPSSLACMLPDPNP